MIGPLRLGDPGAPRDYALQCLAVAADGEFAARVSVAGGQLEDATAMWAHVACELDEARRRPLPGGENPRAITPADCLRAWSSPESWITLPSSGDPVHRSVRSLARLLEIRELAKTSILTDEQRISAEREAQEALAAQVAPAVFYVLQGLRTDLFEVIRIRQRLSISLVHRLLELARPHGPSATSYTLQAIRTESLPLLHLAASGYPMQESRQLREALFGGHSLPSALAEMGVSKAAHRRTLRPASRGAVSIPDAQDDWSELPLSGADWLSAMRAIKKRVADRAANWSELRSLLTRLFSLDVRDTATAPKLLRWCTAPGYRQSSSRLERLVLMARTIQKAAARLAHTELTLDQAITLAMTQVDGARKGRCDQEDASADLALSPRDAGQLVMLVSRISGKSIEQLTQDLFEVHPGLPSGLQLPTDTTIEALSSLQAMVSHGTACGNCLQDAERAIQYAADGLALYAVSVKGRIGGTIALRSCGFKRSQKVLVREVSGMNNADPSRELSRSADALAGSWTADEQLAAWLAYERACKRWKQSLD